MQQKKLFSIKQKSSSLILKLSALCLCVSGTITASAGEAPQYFKEVPPPAPRFFFALNAGAEFDLAATDFITQSLDAYADNFGDDIIRLVNARSFPATHEPVWATRGDLGYNVNPWLSLFVGFTVDYARGRRYINTGITVVPPYIVSNQAGVTANRIDHVSDYNAYAGRGGFRLNIPPRFTSWLPSQLTLFFTYSAGGKWLNQQRVSYGFPNLEFPFIEGEQVIYDSGWVFTTDGQVGAEWGFTPNTSVGIQAGAGYDTKPSHLAQHPSVTTSAAFGPSSKGGDRLYIPVSLFAKVQF